VIVLGGEVAGDVVDHLGEVFDVHGKPGYEAG
jgi:hypothetical protein